MYSLKLFDETLITFDMERDVTLKIFNIKEISKNRKIYPELLQDIVDDTTIEAFLKQRIIPKNRAFVEQILEAQNLNIKDVKGIIDVCKGLSLNDCYWIVDNEDLKFEDYNLYDNNFSDVISLIAFTGYSSKIKGIATSPEYTTNGALPKAWRRIDGKIYLYKGSTERWNFSNTGYEPYSEYYAAQLAEVMGINAVKYDLCRWKGELASYSELFTSKEYSYVPIYLASKTDNIEKIFYWLKEHGLKNEFADMIIFDSLILNSDRHLGNFGLLKDNMTGKYVSFAPIFDNGEGLLSKGDINAFENEDSFNKYVSNPSINISQYGIDYKKLVSTFCDLEQIKKLRKVLTFKFKEHEKYNLPKERLHLLNLFINKRASELIDVIEKIK